MRVLMLGLPGASVVAVAFVEVSDRVTLAHLSPFRQALPGSLKTPMPAASACGVGQALGICHQA